jgi:excisionase family DNA binding protein
MEMEMLTPEELAARLKVRKSWIFEKTRRRAQDPLPCIRVGRYVRFSWADVTRWLEKHSTGGSKNGEETDRLYRKKG